MLVFFSRKTDFVLICVMLANGIFYSNAARTRYRFHGWWSSRRVRARSSRRSRSARTRGYRFLINRQHWWHFPKNRQRRWRFPFLVSDFEFSFCPPPFQTDWLRSVVKYFFNTLATSLFFVLSTLVIIVWRPPIRAYFCVYIVCDTKFPVYEVRKSKGCKKICT